MFLIGSLTPSGFFSAWTRGTGWSMPLHNASCTAKAKRETIGILDRAESLASIKVSCLVLM
jgi:hypothetical protein